MPSTVPAFDHEKLKAARRAAKVRREQVCADLGISYDTLRRYESGATIPLVTTAARLAELCRVDLRELVA
jgi:transcriptional regulator with XRE-family HTH domain